MVLDSLVPHCLLHRHPHGGEVRGAAGEHVDQGLLHMEALILAPEHTNQMSAQSINRFITGSISLK